MGLEDFKGTGIGSTKTGGENFVVGLKSNIEVPVSKLEKWDCVEETEDGYKVSHETEFNRLIVEHIDWDEIEDGIIENLVIKTEYTPEAVKDD
jgi:hypothetical protein